MNEDGEAIDHEGRDELFVEDLTSKKRKMKGEEGGTEGKLGKVSF